MSKTYSEKTVKPFLKWAGGKTQLIDEISKYYLFDNNKIFKYAEPFVGGGAILFDILNKYDIEYIYISDINSQLINTYKNIRDNINELIYLLKLYENQYINLDINKRKTYYINKRHEFNLLNKNPNYTVNNAALMIFLNKTCFNGLYRVNKKGEFNVPIGSYKNPLICDEKNLFNVSKKLKNINIMCDDYKTSYNFIDKNTFVYFDPPYKPLTQTSNFTSYTQNLFDDNAQIELSKYINKLNKKGAKIVLSNSDPKNINKNDNFFDDIYKGYKIKRVNANRMINCKGNMRTKINELIISNF